MATSGWRDLVGALLVCLASSLSGAQLKDIRSVTVAFSNDVLGPRRNITPKIFRTTIATLLVARSEAGLLPNARVDYDALRAVGVMGVQDRHLTGSAPLQSTSGSPHFVRQLAEALGHSTDTLMVALWKDALLTWSGPLRRPTSPIECECCIAVH